MKEGRIRQTGSYLLTAYLCLLFPALSLYMPDGYRELGNAKFAVYRAVSLPFAAALLICTAALVLQKIRTLTKSAPASAASGGARGTSGEGNRSRLLPADAAAILYGVFLSISFALSFDRSESLWGTRGWHIGWLTELLFLAFYFFARLYPVRLRAAAASAGISSAAVLALALADRLGLRFFSFMGSDASFISTIGNVDWYCGYLALAASAALGALLGAPAKRPAAALFVLPVLLSVMTQGADTGFLILIMAILCTFAIFAGFGRTGKKARIVRRIFVTILLLAMAGLLLLPLLWYDPPHTAQMLQRTILLRSRHSFVTELAAAADSFGNGRGAIWRITWELWRALPPVRKLFGIGPDAYAAYVQGAPERNALVIAVFGASRLTNAHNELFSLLMDEGLLAAAAWLLFLFLAAGRLFRRARAPRSALTLTALFAIVTLSAVQAVTFRTMTATPVLWLLIGMALREHTDGEAAGTNKKQRSQE